MSITGQKTRPSTILAIFAGKLAQKLCSLFPLIGGTAFPGLISLKLQPNLINQISCKNQLNSIIITGTNGKTTTSRLLGHILSTNSTAYLQNRTGSNLLRGLASTMVTNSKLNGQLKTKLAIWEVDEAVLPLAVTQLKPKYILFTNLFRDQLDRYGEIDSILKIWEKTLNLINPDTKVILNIDDPSLNYLARKLKPSQLHTYGLPAKLMTKGMLPHAADAAYCPVCHQALVFNHIFTSHLGHYHCSKCNFKRQPPNTNYQHISSLADQFNLTETYQLYSLMAAFILGQHLAVPTPIIKQAVTTFRPVFGRGERFAFGSKTGQIHLIKNPAGFNIILESLNRKKQLNSQPLLIAINDLIADGQDVSWLWDADLELLSQRQQPIIVSGLRAHDMALRLKYAGVAEKAILVQPKLKAALELFKSHHPSPLHLLATYTAMLKIRRILTQQEIIHSTWSD